MFNYLLAVVGSIMFYRTYLRGYSFTRETQTPRHWTANQTIIDWDLGYESDEDTEMTEIITK